VAVFEKKSDDIRAFRSRVSILENGAAVRQETLAVNHPLIHRGYWLYQSNYRPEDPSYSGILVMKDPGLGIVYAGFVMVSLGMILSFYGRPRLRRAAAGKAAS
jgi:cytochrome c biogenesis protein ResB